MWETEKSLAEGLPLEAGWRLGFLSIYFNLSANLWGVIPLPGKDARESREYLRRLRQVDNMIMSGIPRIPGH
jgi:hypothetical protein